MDVEAICTHLGIGPDTIRKRLKRGWSVEQAISRGRYQTIIPRKPHKGGIKLRQKQDQDYTKHRVTYPLTTEQVEVNRLLQGWRR